jgi:hypothetical protein
MSRIPVPLDRLTVASPCTASWDDMRGGDRVRFCDHCQLNVYNLSALTRSAAEKLVIDREGRLCVRFYRRPDDTVLTQDCPRGLAAVRAALWWAAAHFLIRIGAVGLLLGFLVGVWLPGRTTTGGSSSNPLLMLASWVRGGGTTGTPMMGAPVPPPEVIGDVCPHDEPVQGKPALPEHK